MVNSGLAIGRMGVCLVLTQARDAGQGHSTAAVDVMDGADRTCIGKRKDIQSITFTFWQ